MGNENPHALPALNEEARRRGMTYGQLVGATTEAERKEIVDEYTKAYAARRRRAKAKAAEKNQ